MKWTGLDVFIVVCLSCAVVIVHNLLQYHPPFPRPPPLFLEKMGLWRGKASKQPLAYDKQSLDDLRETLARGPMAPGYQVALLKLHQAGGSLDPDDD
jgi:hypothetical protein